MAKEKESTDMSSIHADNTLEELERRLIMINNDFARVVGLMEFMTQANVDILDFVLYAFDEEPIKELFSMVSDQLRGSNYVIVAVPFAPQSTIQSPVNYWFVRYSQYVCNDTLVAFQELWENIRAILDGDSKQSLFNKYDILLGWRLTCMEFSCTLREYITFLKMHFLDNPILMSYNTETDSSEEHIRVIGRVHSVGSFEGEAAEDHAMSASPLIDFSYDADGDRSFKTCGIVSEEEVYNYGHNCCCICCNGHIAKTRMDQVAPQSMGFVSCRAEECITILSRGSIKIKLISSMLINTSNIADSELVAKVLSDIRLSNYCFVYVVEGKFGVCDGTYKAMTKRGVVLGQVNRKQTLQLQSTEPNVIQVDCSPYILAYAGLVMLELGRKQHIIEQLKYICRQIRERADNINNNRQSGFKNVLVVGYTDTGRTAFCKKMCGDENIYYTRAKNISDTIKCKVYTSTSLKCNFIDTPGFGINHPEFGNDDSLVKKEISAFLIQYGPTIDHVVVFGTHIGHSYVHLEYIVKFLRDIESCYNSLFSYFNCTSTIACQTKIDELKEKLRMDGHCIQLEIKSNKFRIHEPFYGALLHEDATNLVK